MELQEASAMKRRNWAVDEKLAIVVEELKEKRSVSDICREHRISQTLYYRWRNKFLEAGKKEVAMFKTKLSTCVLVFLCTCLFGANLFAQTRADSTWPMFHHDPHHTGLSPLTGVMDTCSFYWSYTTGNNVWSSPALGDIDGDGKLEVVVGSFDNNVYALNGENGSFLWSYTTGDFVMSSLSLKWCQAKM
jgi:outer membrane protein assembly factor BamB